MNNQISPFVSDQFQIGAILRDSFGYEQTNIDFFCIISRKGEYVTVLPMIKMSSAEGSAMTKSNMPTQIDWSAKPQRKKVKSYQGKEIGFSFRNYSGGGWCNLWSGKPQTSTHYA